MKFWGINLTKHMQDMHTDNYKVLMKETKEGLNKWRHTVFINWKTQHSRDVKHLQLIYRLNATSNQNHRPCCRNSPANSKISMKMQRDQNSQKNFENKVGEITPPNFRTYYKVTAIKTAWYWQRQKTIEVRNKPTETWSTVF